VDSSNFFRFNAIHSDPDRHHWKKKKLSLVVRTYQEQYLNAGPPHPPRKQESKKRPSAAVSSTVVMHPAKSRLPAQRPHMQAQETLQPRDENEVKK
jgi:hypothetical protein